VGALGVEGARDVLGSGRVVGLGERDQDAAARALSFAGGGAL
jgi:hypothetical protein